MMNDTRFSTDLELRCQTKEWISTWQQIFRKQPDLAAKVAKAVKRRQKATAAIDTSNAGVSIGVVTLRNSWIEQEVMA